MFSALQLHPNVPSLYIIAAQHELAHLSPSAARVLLQRGIRLNAESVEMWREYVKFELGFVESMRRRWDVLGIGVNRKGKAKANSSAEDGMDESEVEKMQVEADAEGDEAEEARRAIMQGAIVKSVITNAVKGMSYLLSCSVDLMCPRSALPSASLFVSLHELLSTYPTTSTLRSALLDHLHTLLLQVLPTDPVAVRLTATRNLLPDVTGDALVDTLKDANDKLTSAVWQACSTDSTKDADGMAISYAEFVQEWVMRENVDDSLVCTVFSPISCVSG
jgi:U3 small nucleolar RNA-associated protein 6